MTNIVPKEVICFLMLQRFLKQKKPKVFFLENVRGLVSHDNGNTFKIISNVLENKLGYSFYFKRVKASDYGLSQLRPRAFMVGFRDDIDAKDFKFPDPLPYKIQHESCLGRRMQ